MHEKPVNAKTLAHNCYPDDFRVGVDFHLRNYATPGRRREFERITNCSRHGANGTSSGINHKRRHAHGARCDASVNYVISVTNDLIDLLRIQQSRLNMELKLSTIEQAMILCQNTDGK